jgi:hypothetical protein
MNLLKTAALGLAFVTLTSGAAFAEGAMMKSDGAMKTDSMAAKPMAMSAADAKTMKACKAMPHDKMMKTKKCAATSAMHTDSMKSGAPASTGSMMSSDAMSADAMKH